MTLNFNMSAGKSRVIQYLRYYSGVEYIFIVLQLRLGVIGWFYWPQRYPIIWLVHKVDGNLIKLWKSSQKTALTDRHARC